MPIALSVCRLSISVCRVVYYGQTVQDSPIVCVEVEHKCGNEISIGATFDPLGPPKTPNKGSNWGGGSKLE